MARTLVWIYLLGGMIVGANIAASQPYPNKSIHIATTVAGGGNDFAARLIAQGLTSSLGQPVVVDNRAGTLSTDLIAKAAPDGYNLLIAGSILWILPFMRDNVPYDPVRDFSPITWAVSSPNILAVHPSLPVKSVKELIALSKARPGQLNYSTSGAGSGPNISMEVFKAMTGVNIIHVPYKGTPAASIALLIGEVQATFNSVTAVAPYAKSGRLKALAIGSVQPSALFPELPTVAASGVPGFESVTAAMVLAPAKTPDAIIARLHQDIVRVLNQADSKKKLFDTGAEVVANSPADLATKIQAEMIRVGKVVKDAGIRAD